MASRDDDSNARKRKFVDDDFVLVDEYDCLPPEERPDKIKLHLNSRQKVELFISMIHDKLSDVDRHGASADCELRNNYKIKHAEEIMSFTKVTQSCFVDDALAVKFISFMKLLGIGVYECVTALLYNNVFKDNNVVRSIMAAKLHTVGDLVYTLGFQKYCKKAGNIVFSTAYLDDELMYRIYNTTYNYLLSDTVAYNAKLPCGKMPDATDLTDLINITHQYLEINHF